MAVLTDLTQFDRDEIENSIVDVAGLDRPVARKIVDSVLVPQIDVRTGAAVRRALEGAAADVERVEQINDTPYDDVTASDRAWHYGQESLRIVLGLRDYGRGAALAAWLRARALRGTR